MKIILQERHAVEATYRGHAIKLSREDFDDRWYIQVRDRRGCYAYDGFWKDSSGKSHGEAIYEACRGSMLLPSQRKASVEISKKA